MNILTTFFLSGEWYDARDLGNVVAGLWGSGFSLTPGMGGATA
jgi:hypothetical protein